MHLQIFFFFEIAVEIRATISDWFYRVIYPRYAIGQAIICFGVTQTNITDEA